GQPRFSAEQVSEWSRRIVQYQGAVTWDVPIQPSGLMAQVFMDQLKVIGAAVAAVNPEISR
ncbi:MAG TPA: hypothetical protein P5175_06610, partial [Anaerohalosphaeraceae bacterium]|nr:hypothetical protein [Anaerohalosphaeraceae bacterium]